MIQAQGLTRQFGTFIAVRDVSFSVPDGGLLALLGPNGAGKTTTVRMLAGLLAPTTGDATVAGFDIRTQPDLVRAQAGIVTDSPGLHEQMLLPEYLEFFGALYGMPPAVRQSRVNELIEFFELGTQRKQRMISFSKGMKQKVALARALLHDPAALFLDEPTSGLDPLSSRAVREMIVSLKHSRRSIILCTHDLDEAERLADTVVIMQQGQIRAAGTPQELRARSSGDTFVTIELADAYADRTVLLRDLHDLPLHDLQSEALRVTYRTAQPQMVNPAAIAALVAADAHILAVTCATQSLEDVYAAAVTPQTHDKAEPLAAITTHA